jgi:hypothetical protein
MAGNLPKTPQNIPAFSFARPCKICPIFWFKNIPSGNPATFLGIQADPMEDARGKFEVPPF